MLELSGDQIATLTQAGIIPAGTPPAQVSVFAETCRQHSLSPFKKEIYLVGYAGKYSTIIGIDGLRVKAARTGQLAGCDAPRFNESADGSYMAAADLKGAMPATCTVTVYRIVSGHRVPFTATVSFNEFCPIKPLPSSKWITMPLQMIAKVAEAFALRKGFADEVSGLGIEEEQAAYTDTQIGPKGIDTTTLASKLAACTTTEDLRALYVSSPAYKAHAQLFTQRKNDIENG
jgi:phage recombination protein Bet